MSTSEGKTLLCPICRLPVELGVELHTDEKDQTVHEECYVKKIALEVKRAVPRYSAESRFDCFA
jgi:hypothetical protein